MKNSKSAKDAAVDWKRMTSREGVLECPHLMAVAGYLIETHNLPRYGWRNKSLRYHYTDASGLLGVITSSRLWVTDIQFLNDPSEGQFLPEALFSLMEKKEAGLNDLERSIIAEVRKAFANPRSTSSTFCLSLCGNGDLLSQWRGYGSFGKGYAIGLELSAGQPHPQLGLFCDVVYGASRLKELADDLLDLFVQASGKWKDQMYDEWAATIRFLSTSFKHESYAEENESRIICHYTKSDDYLFNDEAPIRFRTRGGDIVPYIPLSLQLMRDGEATPKLPIRRIVAGPGVDFERNQSSLVRLLKEHGYDDVDVARSAVPFRV